MLVNELIYTNKWVDVINDNSTVIFLEGPSQVSKTTLSGVKLMREVLNAPQGQTIFFLVGESTPTLYRNFVEPETSITNLFKYVARYVGGKEGGERIEVTCSYDGMKEVKKIFFIGFSNKSAGNKILGGKPYLIFIDEINKAHDQFIKEVMTRVQAVGAKLIATSNGDSPDLLCYDYLNQCRPTDKYRQDVPKSTMEQMNERKAKEGWTYYFFKLDDRPGATAKWIEGMYSMHPEGSFEYNSKVLGIRAAVDGILYGHLLTKLHDVPFNRINIGAIKDLTVGIDVGSGGTDDSKKRAKSIFTLTGFSTRYERVVVLDGYESKQIGHLETVQELNEWLYEWTKIFGARFSGIYIDNAEPALISTARIHLNYNIDVKGSIKQNALVSAKSRVAMKEQLIHQFRLLFTDRPGAQMIKQQLAKVKGINGITIDDNEKHNDVNDSLDYALTPKFAKLQNVRRLH